MRFFKAYTGRQIFVYLSDQILKKIRANFTIKVSKQMFLTQAHDIWLIYFKNSFIFSKKKNFELPAGNNLHFRNYTFKNILKLNNNVTLKKAIFPLDRYQ